MNNDQIVQQLQDLTGREWEHKINEYDQLCFETTDNYVDEKPLAAIGENRDHFIVYVEMMYYEQYFQADSIEKAMDAVNAMLSSANRFNTKVVYKGPIESK
jgi:hypothetical protein